MLFLYIKVLKSIIILLFSFNNYFYFKDIKGEIYHITDSMNKKKNLFLNLF